METLLNSKDGFVIVVVNLMKKVSVVIVEKPSKPRNSPILLFLGKISNLYKSIDFLTKEASIADNIYKTDFLN